MASTSLERDPVELLADDFAGRCRRGESPSIAAFAAEHPEYADRIERLFPAVAMLERLRGATRVARPADTRALVAAPPQDLGDFRLVQEIGRGGMGIVYEAQQRSLRRRVAVKILPEHALLRDHRLRRFQREAQTAAQLRHTNIVPVFGIGEQGGLHYYVMPLVRGVGLDEVLRELKAQCKAAGRCLSDIVPDGALDTRPVTKRLIARKFGPAEFTAPSENPVDPVPAASGSGGMRDDAGSGIGRQNPDSQTAAGFGSGGRARYWQTVADIGLQAAEALEFAHAHGTLHRDIKPSNLLLDGNGVVSVADFGLARAVDGSQASRSGDVVGTLRYMAPEQMRGSVERRSDVYALGLTLYELLTFRLPFADPDRRAALRGAQADWEPARPRKWKAAIPRDLETIVLKCLATEPSRRYGSAAALAADLRCFLADRPIDARRASWLERAWRWRRRNPALATTSGLAVVLVMAMIVTASLGYIANRRACADAQDALVRAESTSQLALGVLDSIYLCLAPDRMLITSDSDPGGGACACVGLRSLTPGQRPMQVAPSEETAALLQNLLVFYDRLAEQTGSSLQVLLQSAVASRRVGDIRQRLGQWDSAESAYRHAVEKLTNVHTSVVTPESCAELAHCHNEIGNVRSARFEFASAYAAHRLALDALLMVENAAEAPAAFRYELARTYYFLASKRAGKPDELRGSAVAEVGSDRIPPTQGSGSYRRLAIRLLEQLAHEQPDVPDYRLLLALCYRPAIFGPASESGFAATRSRQEALRILEELTTAHPDVADYQYELATTYAWTPVRLYPWQRRTLDPSAAEQDLRKALAASQWLVAHHPANSHYVRCEALVLAKLAAICWETGRPDQAADFFQQALLRQIAATAASDSSAEQRVFTEFVRLRLAQVQYENAGGQPDPELLRSSRRLLETCIANLTALSAQAEYKRDPLARSSLSLAIETLKKVAVLEDHASPDDRVQDPRAGDLGFGDRQKVAGQHHDVGELAGGE